MGVERLESREDTDDAVLYKKFMVIRNKEIFEGTISTVGQGGRLLVQSEERLTESRQAEDEMDLNRVVAAVAVETEGTEGAAHAIETVHVAFVPVGISVVLALDEEVRRQKRPQPRWPPASLLLHRPSSTLFHSVSLSSESHAKANRCQLSNAAITIFR